jgi:hypothetical protein
MTRHPTPSANADQPSDHSWARPLFEQQIALLGELAEAGMAVAMAIRDQVVAGEGGNPIALANAYARVARAVRMTILLQSKLIQQLLDWDRQAARPAAQSQHEALVDQRRAERDREDAEHIERLIGEGSEPRDRDDIYDLVHSRPVSELIARIWVWVRTGCARRKRCWPKSRSPRTLPRTPPHRPSPR